MIHTEQTLLTISKSLHLLALPKSSSSKGGTQDSLPQKFAIRNVKLLVFLNLENLAKLFHCFANPWCQQIKIGKQHYKKKLNCHNLQFEAFCWPGPSTRN